MSETIKIHFLSLLTIVVVSVVCTAGYVVAATNAEPNVNDMSDKYNKNVGRPCHMVPGGWTTIDSNNSTAVLSGQISDFAAFLLQCDADTRFVQGSSAAVADTGDGWIAAGAILKLGTSGSGRYLSVINKVHPTDDCHYVECR